MAQVNRLHDFQLGRVDFGDVLEWSFLPMIISLPLERQLLDDIKYGLAVVVVKDLSSFYNIRYFARIPEDFLVYAEYAK